MIKRFILVVTFEGVDVAAVIAALVTVDVGLEVDVLEAMDVFILGLGNVVLKEMYMVLLKDLALVVAALLVVLGQPIDPCDSANILRSARPSRSSHA